MAIFRRSKARRDAAEEPLGSGDPTAEEHVDDGDLLTVTEVEPEPDPEPADPTEIEYADSDPSAPEADVAVKRRRFSPTQTLPVLLLQTAHPRQALVTALGLAVAAALSGRPAREIAAVFATVLIGQAILGMHNDLVDRQRDEIHQTPHKPIADGRLDAGTVWFTVAVGLLLVVPLSISTGLTAGTFYLAALLIGIAANVLLRRGVLSWVPWAAQFALYPAYLSNGGWGGGAEGTSPTVTLVVLAALLGIGVHMIRSIWGLVADNEDGWTYLPLRLGLKWGATRLLTVATVYTVAVVAALAVVGATSGLSAP